MTVRIQPISEEHIEDFHKCLDIVAQERKYLAFIQAPDLDSVRKFVGNNIKHSLPQYVAVKEGKVIGWCDIIPQSLEGFRHSGNLGMGVHPEFRRQGIGTKLISATLAKAKEQGLERIQLAVLASNTAAISLYEKIGFAKEGIRKKARKLDNKYDDLLLMALFF